MKKCRKFMTWLLCMLLYLLTAMIIAGCGTSQPDDSVQKSGEKTFFLTVVDQDGAETEFEIHTDQEMVGAALQEEGLISGEEGDYGLYVKTVNGITADYDADKSYWAFYIDGEYATSGVDTTAIQEGSQYMFKVEK